MNHYEFVEKHGITMDAVKIDKRPDGLHNDGTNINWLVTFTADDNAEAFYFSHGFNWVAEGSDKNKPDAVSVLWSLQLDALIVEDTDDMWDFFEEFGIEATKYNAHGYALMVHTVEKLKNLLGVQVYQEFMELEEA